MHQMIRIFREHLMTLLHIDLTKFRRFRDKVSKRRRSQDFVWGSTFYCQKVDDLLFLVVAPKDRVNSKYTSKSNSP